MTHARAIPAARHVALGVGLASLLLGGCAHLQPPPVPRVPRLGLGGGPGSGACAAEIARAHVALASAATAAGDPAATASAHAAHATAMAAHHACLSQPGRP